jgi:hypothetical protein
MSAPKVENFREGIVVITGLNGHRIYMRRDEIGELIRRLTAHMERPAFYCERCDVWHPLFDCASRG